MNGEVVALLKRNRNVEALALADEILQRAGDRTQAAQLADLASELPWTRTYRARALLALGRQQEAASDMQIASRTQSDGDFAATINLADFYARGDTPDQALAVTAQLPALHGDSEMQVEWAKACAYARKGDGSGADEALAYLRAHENESLDALTEALLCDNREDELAKVYIRRLGAEPERADALLAMQRYAQPPSEPPFQKLLKTRRLQVFRRPDVAAVVRAVGGIESWPLQLSNY